MLKNKRYRQLAEINVVPYIDVMLVLLIIFMVTAPMLYQGVDVNLPQAKSKPLSTKSQEPLVLTVDARGNYYLNIAPCATCTISAVEVGRLVAQTLAPSSPNNASRHVLIKGDLQINYGKIMQAMVLLQQSGARHIGLLTQEEK